MKKWGILIGGIILGFIVGGQAQTDMEAMFSSDNQNIIYANQPKDYTGAPLVFIEGISDKPQPKDWKDELKIKLFGSMEIPKAEIQKPLPPLEQNDNNVQKTIKINSLFGGEKEVAFVPHTSDWSFIIQVLNDTEIVIQEDIQFIKTANTPSPVRDWAKQDMQLLKVQINGQEIPLKLSEESDVLRLKFPEFGTGVHKVRLTYLVKGAGIFSKKEAQISLALTNTGWNLPTDSFSGVVLFPVSVQKVKTSFLLGKNHQEIKGAFDSGNDSTGSLFFRSTHLIPENSAIQMNLKLEYDSFIKQGLKEKITNSTSFLIFIVSLGIILLYLILNIIEIKITPVEEMMLKRKFLTSSNMYKNFLYRTREIWIGLVLLWFCTFCILRLMNTSFGTSETFILFLIPIVFILIMDYFLLYPLQEKIKKIRGQ